MNSYYQWSKCCFRFCYQEEKYIGYENEDIIPFIPNDYWLRGTKTRCLLACMVHRMNKEVATNVSSLRPGQTREEQHENAAERIVMERQIARNARKRDNDEEDTTHKRLRNHIGMMSVIKSQNDVVSVQLCLYNENRQAFIATMGEDAYNQKIIDLLNKLPDPSAVNNLAGDTASTSVDVASSVGDSAD